MSDDLFADNWRHTALEELACAEILHREAKFQQAYYHAGMAVECALKYQIMRQTGMNRWPDRKTRPDIYVHELIALARISGVEAKLLDVLTAGDDITMVLAWQVAKDWTIGTRYDPRPFPPARANGMIDAVTKKGLVEWILGQ